MTWVAPALWPLEVRLTLARVAPALLPTGVDLTGADVVGLREERRASKERWGRLHTLRDPSWQQRSGKQSRADWHVRGNRSNIGSGGAEHCRYFMALRSACNTGQASVRCGDHLDDAASKGLHDI